MTKSVLLSILIIGSSYLQAQNPQSRIFLILNESSTSHSQFFTELQQQLDFESQRLQKVDIKNFSRLTQGLAEQDLIITVGTQAFEQVLQTDLINSVWATLIPAQSFYSLTNIYTKTNAKAWFINQPIKRRVALIKTVLPNVSNYGVLINESYRYQLDELVDEFNKNDLELVIKRVPAADSPINLSKDLFDQIEALFALVDPKILNRNTAKGILLSSYRRNIPVIAYSNSYVQAGALAAVYSTPAQLARQLAEDLNGFISGNTTQIDASHYPQYFSVAFNNKVARSLSIKPLSEDFIHKAISKHNND